MDHFGITIVGAGVIGLAIARELSQDPQLAKQSILVLESEARPGQHISSRSSEVIHAGIYYAPGSLKASLCLKGRELLYQYCERYQVAHRRLGKHIVAPANGEGALQLLYNRAEANGVEDLEWISRGQLKAREPAVRAESALFSPSTGIVDSHELMQSLQKQAQDAGVDFAFKTPLVAMTSSGGNLVLRTGTQPDFSFSSSVVINCAGLQAQAIAGLLRRASTASMDIPALWPCKGTYFSYSGVNPFNSLIYPMPDENTRGLGIHSTVDLAGGLRFGPDAEYVEGLDYAVEGSKAAEFCVAIRNYFPALEAHRLSPSYAGIRPKISGPGEPARDFEISVDELGNSVLINLYGFESPGLTGCLAIGEHVTALVRNMLR